MEPLAGGPIETHGELRESRAWSTRPALPLWHELDDGAAQVEAVLSLPAAVRFYGALARGELLPSGETGRILDAMCRIVPEQRWGLGAADPLTPFKSGWGPSESPEGGYEVIQVGIAGPTVIAIAARAEDFEAAKRLASKHVPQHPNAP